MVYTAHDVPDLINSLPTLFGFTPTESLIAIATSGPRRRFGFRLRVDIPAADDIPGLAGIVVGHLGQQGAEGAVLIAVTERQDVAAPLIARIACDLPPIELVTGVRATTTRYWTTDPGFPCDGVAYATSGHHLSIVKAIAAGQEILPDRQALVERFAAVAGLRRRFMVRATEEMVHQVAPLISRAEGADLAEIGMREVEPILERGLTRWLDDTDLVRLSVWLSAVAVRDAVWARITRDNADAMLRMLIQVSRHVVPPFEPAVLSLTAFAAWLTGDGAQALIAAERALQADPRYQMARLILQLLEGGVSPSHWAGYPAEDDTSP